MDFHIKKFIDNTKHEIELHKKSFKELFDIIYTASDETIYGFSNQINGIHPKKVKLLIDENLANKIIDNSTFTFINYEGGDILKSIKNESLQSLIGNTIDGVTYDYNDKIVIISNRDFGKYQGIYVIDSLGSDEFPWCLRRPLIRFTSVFYHYIEYDRMRINKFHNSIAGVEFGNKYKGTFWKFEYENNPNASFKIGDTPVEFKSTQVQKK
jgi:hypothetical protein